MFNWYSMSVVSFIIILQDTLLSALFFGHLHPPRVGVLSVFLGSGRYRTLVRITTVSRSHSIPGRTIERGGTSDSATLSGRDSSSPLLSFRFVPLSSSRSSVRQAPLRYIEQNVEAGHARDKRTLYLCQTRHDRNACPGFGDDNGFVQCIHGGPHHAISCVC